MGLNNINLKMITPRALMFGSMKKYINPIVAAPARNFGIIQEYNERRSKKLTNNILTTDRNMHWVTSSRPSNFGDPLDVKTKVDNWFDENRAWNEENRDYEIRRTQIYMAQGFIVSSYVLGIKTILTCVYGQMLTTNRYIRDTYKEIDVGDLPPGEVIQTWALPKTTELDKESKFEISDAGNSAIVTISAICTHLGCIPIPYLGAYKGWVCLCHGSVYDKFGRVRQGPATGNLP